MHLSAQTRGFTGLVLTTALLMTAPANATGTYDDLVGLFRAWQTLEEPDLRDGAPDYTRVALEQRGTDLKALQSRLTAFDTAAWPREQRIDFELVRAQMNGLEFDLRVLQPWTRDPAFYQSVWTEQSDTPEHEGPAHHGIVELWTYSFPLSRADERQLAHELGIVPPLLTQARGNLTGNARDLWLTGTGTMQMQVESLDDLAAKAKSAGSELRRSIAAAQQATVEFVAWLQTQAPSKTGPSGVGKEAYDWNLRHVHLVPLTWDEEVTLLRRELARAHASLRLEEQRNRGLPPLQPISSPAEWNLRANAAVSKYIDFLSAKEIFTVQDYLDPALRERIGPYSPLETRNFFGIASHYEPITLFAHFQHWFDHAWLRHRPNASPIRREGWLYNVWDSRAEGTATAMEEIILHAGYYDDNPRAREIVWIMLAQRCARGLASLYAQANLFDLQQAKAFQVEWTPRGWMRPDLDLLGFEQQLYLRQPGYGTSYVTGKALLDELIKDRSHQLGDAFTLRGFFDEYIAAGMMPVSLVHWQMTGDPRQVPAPPAAH